VVAGNWIGTNVADDEARPNGAQWESGITSFRPRAADPLR
jgi:hypothetical protein